MAATHISGPLISGTVLENSSKNYGYAVLAQTGTITQNSTTTVDLTFKVPANAQILEFKIDVLTAYNSGTSATLTIGQTSTGTEYVSGVNAKSAGRAAPSLTATQLTNMANVTTNTSVVASVAVSGATSAGSVRVTMLYVQK